MIWGMLIAAGIGAVQLVLTWYAVHISVKENRVRNAVIIGIVGFIGIALTIYGAIRSGTTQLKLESDISELKKGQQTANAGIKQIETTPPTVTVNPQINVNPTQNGPVLSASVVLDAIASSYEGQAIAGGKAISIQTMFVPGQRIQQNIYFRNAGNLRAENVATFGKVYIVTSETEAELIKQYKKDLIAAHLTSGGTMDAAGGSSGVWMTAVSDRAATGDDPTKLADGIERLYIFASVTYRDQHQKHHLHLCRLLQAPDRAALEHGGQEAIWHFCDDFSDAN